VRLGGDGGAGGVSGEGGGRKRRGGTKAGGNLRKMCAAVSGGRAGGWCHTNGAVMSEGGVARQGGAPGGWGLGVLEC